MGKSRLGGIRKRGYISHKLEVTNRVTIQPINMDKWRKDYSGELVEHRIECINSLTGSSSVQVVVYIEVDGNSQKYQQNSLIDIKMGKRFQKKCKYGWRKPIHRTGNKEDCTNYRCIAVTSPFGRLYRKTVESLVEEKYK